MTGGYNNCWINDKTFPNFLYLTISRRESDGSILCEVCCLLGVFIDDEIKFRQADALRTGHHKGYAAIFRCLIGVNT